MFSLRCYFPLRLASFHRLRLSLFFVGVFLPVCELCITSFPALVGLPCGIGVLWLGCSLFDVHIRHRYILAIGAAIGIVAGVIIAFILDRFFRFVYHRVHAGIWIESFAMTTTPNKSPEPTAVGACRSAVAVHAAVRRWLGFFR